MFLLVYFTFTLLCKRIPNKWLHGGNVSKLESKQGKMMGIALEKIFLSPASAYNNRRLDNDFQFSANVINEMCSQKLAAIVTSLSVTASRN